MTAGPRLDSGVCRPLLLIAAAALFSAAVGFAVSRCDARSRPEASVTSMPLPEGWTVTEVAVLGGQPTLFATKPESPPGATTLNGGICRLFVVADDPLRVTSSEAVSCAVGAGLASQVGLNIEYVDVSHREKLHIAEFGSTATSVWPLILVGALLSDTHAEWAKGAGADWLRDLVAPSGGLRSARKATVGDGYSSTLVGASGSAVFMLEQPNGSPRSRCGSALLSRVDLASGSTLIIARLPARRTSDGRSCIGPIHGQSVELAGRIYLLDGYGFNPGGSSELYSIADRSPN